MVRYEIAPRRLIAEFGGLSLRFAAALRPPAQSFRYTSVSSPEPRTVQMFKARYTLPATRRSLTHKFVVGGHEGYLTIGLHTDGSPGEIFIKISKDGSTLSGMCQAFCRAFSLSLQYGLSVEEAVARFKGMRFEPMGQTANPEIPHALSIVDYVARFLELRFADLSVRPADMLAVA